MKPPLFEYIFPTTIEEAVAARAAHDYSAILAGGQSLIPTMNFRIANPGALIDISGIETLRGIRVEDGEVVIGAMARQRDVELDDAVHRANPLIREALQNVAHVPIRNRGTIVGSLAHADAAAEMPAVLLATGGRVIAHGPDGVRTVEADALFQFHMTTSLAPEEIVTEARFPVLADNTGWAFLEFTRRHGDYAIAGVAALITLAADGSCAQAALAACGVGSRAVRLAGSEAALVGRQLDEATIKVAAEAAKPAVTAPDDSHATTAFRQHVLGTVLTRAVGIARQRATERQGT